jgi:hypothetical protein
MMGELGRDWLKGGGVPFTSIVRVHRPYASRSSCLVTTPCPRPSPFCDLRALR